MCIAITKQHLSFVEEAKNAFMNNARLETYRNESCSLIALRRGVDRDCIEVYEIESPVALFVQQLIPAPTPRAIVQDFAYHMETKLQMNDYKGGWKNEHYQYLLSQLKRNLKLLEVELGKKDKDLEEVTIRTLNIANYSMMIADNEGEL